MEEVARKFQNEIIENDAKVRKLGYNAVRFRQMLSEYGAVQTAKKLISTFQPSDGFTKMWELRRLDLTVEAVVIKPEYNRLFTTDEIENCRARLAKYGYIV